MNKQEVINENNTVFTELVEVLSSVNNAERAFERATTLFEEDKEIYFEKFTDLTEQLKKVIEEFAQRVTAVNLIEASAHAK